MSDPVAELNYDFNYNMFLVKTMLNNLQNAGDRDKALTWIRKLGTCNRSINEMKLRNDFLYYLVVNVQHGQLQEPFNQSAPPNPLPDIAHLLTGGGVDGANDDPNFWDNSKDKGEKGKKPLVFESSPDGGAFLASQPIPRCGAFCYLAVVTKDKQE